ncbi:BatA domain-containing protein [Candidatus Woesearchaeota archaeon]|nr:BatA domain-containing protein [Candidatus Woesearchaeota archaeon]
MPFKNPLGLYALLALIPFILLYMRRPKPKEKTIPSLMFFLREQGVTKFSNFFKQILQNLLFLVQLAIILSVAFSAASPFFTSEKAATAKQTVIVIDGSASMNARLSGELATRFEKAAAQAGELIEGDAGVVLATNIPVVMLERGSSSEARKILSALKAKATETHIGDAMLAAGELVEDPKKSKVVVISDFQENQGTDVLVAKRSLAARGINVVLANVLSEETLNELSNVGFAELDINKFQTTALIKNYDDAERAIDIEVLSNGKEVSTEHLVLEPRSLEPVSFDTLNGKTQLRIKQDDDLETDNSLFINSPTKKVKALLITNSDTSYIMAALKSSPSVELDVAFPPVIKHFGYDVIIIHNASSQFMLPGFYKEINKAVANGTGLVITAQESLPTYIKQLNMPIEPKGMANTSKANTKVENRLTKGIDFGVVARHYTLSNKSKESQFTTLVAADDESPLIATYTSGSGAVTYYGLLDDASSFRSSYFYPIFWDNLMGFLTKSDDIASFNVLTGKIEGISEQQVETPNGKIRTARLFFDDAGFYSYGAKTVAANLLSKEESNIRSADAAETGKADSTLSLGAVQTKAELQLESKLIFAGIALLFLELLIIKMRGDL